MFDRLIVTETNSANFKNRSRYFLVSGAIVAVLFTSAVIASIYAADYALDNAGFELTTMLPPIMPAADKPEPETPQQARSSSPAQSDAAVTRQFNIERVNEGYTIPDGVSSVPVKNMARPNGRWTISDKDSGLGSGSPDGKGNGDGREGNSGSNKGLSVGDAVDDGNVEVAKVPPPPVIEKKETRPPAVKSLGVINGKATSLPVPPYPQAAVAMNLTGSVSVNVTINQSGKVVSAKAVSGPALFRGVAERAALGARFDPTTLSNVPVTVKGVIVYKFKR